MVEESARSDRILDPNLTPSQRLEALNKFKASGDTMPRDILEKVLLIADAQLRQSALELCDRQQETVSSKVGRTLLYDSSPEVRVRAIPCLGRTDKQKEESFLQEIALNDPREDIRAKAIQEIRDLKITGVASPLLLRLQELVEAWLAESGKATDDLEAALEDQELLVLLKEHLSRRGDGETGTEPSANSSSKSRIASGVP